MDEFLEECLKLAQARDQKIAVAAEQVDLAQLRVTGAIRSFFPQLYLQSEQSKGKTALNTLGGLDTEEYKSESIGARASLPLYTGGGTKANYRYNKMMKDAAKYNYTKAKEDLYANVKLAYYEYLTLKMEYVALSKAFEEVENLFLKTRVEYKARAISNLDLAESENFRDKVANLLSSSRINLEFSTQKLIEIVGVNTLEEIPATVSDELPSDAFEIAFTVQDCISFVQSNNLDVQLAKLQLDMADQKIKMNKAKIHPQIYAEGFYGKMGEAFVTEPLELTTQWTLAAKLSWGLWGNSLAASYSMDRTDPTTIVDASKRTEVDTFSIQLGILDDIQYFVDAKESSVSKKQLNSDLIDLLKNSRLAVEKAYNEYILSLNNARTTRNELKVKERKLALLKKRNDLYEVETVSLMEESWNYAEAIASFARALYSNHAAIVELEKLTLMSLR
ncbi:MAG: TolC family protein [Elusimicrobia bacterium]|nr:TolC family protein [Elusimicrobiota bacterium]